MGLPVLRKSCSARSAIPRISDKLDVQQENVQEVHLDRDMMILARVVFPQPGGPVKIIDGGGSFSKRRRTMLSLENNSSFPYV